MSSTPMSHDGLAGGTPIPREPPAPVDPRLESLAIFGLEFSLNTASLDALEVVARRVTKAQVRDWFSRLGGTKEVALLSTCHRIELILLVDAPEELEGWRNVLPGDRGSWRMREGPEAVHHLFRVAAGLESLAVGEAEARHQVRTAGSSIGSRYPRPVLRRLFEGAVAAADEVYAGTSGSCSIASVAARRLLELVDRPLPRVLVVGSGTVGRQVAESLASSARATVLFHRKPPEEAFLRATGARAARLDRLAEELITADAVVTAAKFGNHGLRASDLPRDRPLVLVDLGVPRNIDPNVRELPNARLVDLQELHDIARNLPRVDLPDARLEELAERCSARLARLLEEPWIGAVRRAAEQVRRAEVTNARPFLGTLEPSQEMAVERLTQRLVARLLLLPTERIRSLPPGPEGDRQRRFAVDLLRPESHDP